MVINKKAVLYKNNKIDLIILQSLGKGKSSFFNSHGDIKNSKLKLGYKNKHFEIVSPPSCLIFGRKQSLQILQNSRIQKLLKLNKLEINAIKACAKNFSVNNIRNVTQYKNLVIKITGVGQGKGVFMGNKINTKLINEVTNYIRQNEFKVILQEKIELQYYNIFLINKNIYKKAILQLEPFIFNNGGNKFAIKGYSARAILKNEATNYSKFNPAFNNKKIMFGTILVSK